MLRTTNTDRYTRCCIPVSYSSVFPRLGSDFFERENMKHEKQIRLPVPTRASIFAVPLEELMGYDGEKGGIPRVIKDCIQFLRETGGF